jgi:hypothetical protein
MTKQELIQAAKEIREICKEHSICNKCPFSYINDEGADNACVFDTYFYPEDWRVERLERDSDGE